MTRGNGSATDPFEDLDAHSGKPDDTASTSATEEDKADKQPHGTFIKVPDEYLRRLALETSRRASIIVGLYLIKLNWKSKGEAISLPNAGLEKLGISRQEKWLALGELEERKFIRIERISHKSPRVTLLC